MGVAAARWPDGDLVRAAVRLIPCPSPAWHAPFTYLPWTWHVPAVVHSTWLDRDSGQYVIRVVREPEQQTRLICLAPRSACVYQSIFSLDTPDAVIIAAVEAAQSRAPAAGGRTGGAVHGHQPPAL